MGASWRVDRVRTPERLKREIYRMWPRALTNRFLREMRHDE